MSRRLLILSSLLLATALVGALWWLGGGRLLAEWAEASRASGTGPVAVVGRNEWDFGTVEAGSRLRATFPVTNAGGRHLLLMKHRSSCGCLTPGNDEAILPPGRSLELCVEMRTDQLRGPVRKKQSYTTNDPNLPLLTLVLIADVQPPETGDPESVP